MSKFSHKEEEVGPEETTPDPSKALFDKISKKYAQHVKDRIAHEDFIEKI